MQGVCFNCFHYAPEGQPCPYCGYDASGDAGKYRLALQPGTILANRYLIGRVLGQGGFGITYVALDNSTKSRVALKEYMPTDFAFRDEGTVDLKLNSSEVQEDYEYGKQQFLAEAETLAEFVGNEHIIAIRDRFEANGTAYFAMEYAEGVDLKRYMEQKGGPLRIYEANRILLPIMEALQWVHSKGIVHRDISPDNIMIRSDGKAKLIDFGAARYSTGEKSKSLDVILKHGFAPKEQYSRRGRQGPFTDVYAMAATYYYAITGKVPPDAVDRMDEDTLQPPSALGVNMKEDTEQVLMKALAQNAADRWQTMSVFYSALLQTMPQPFEPGAGEGTGTARKPAVQKEKKPEPKTTARKPADAENKAPAKKKPTAIIAAVLILAILAGVVFGTGILKKNPAVPEPVASTAPTAAVEATPVPEETAAAEDTQEPEPTPAQEETDTPGDFRTVGSVVTFGAYEQDDDLENGKEPIEWIVLDVQDEKSLLISKYALGKQPYNSSSTNVTWETCSLRDWLNDSFLNEAFSSVEKARIPTVTVTADKNPGYETDPGKDTQDRVFLLSIPEANKYFASDAERDCGSRWWWLRSPGRYSTNAALVRRNGPVFDYGNDVSTVDGNVRPALWVDLSKIDVTTIGNTVTFGSYEQDNDLTNGKEPIEWIVLDVQDGKSLVVSKYALDRQQYNSSSTDVTWETCGLRKWLNGTFLKEAFDKDEQARISTATVVADKNPHYGTSPGKDTQDKVFLLSILEANKYFASDLERQCKPTAYVVAQEGYTFSSGNCWWWLRSPGNLSNCAAGVFSEGSVANAGVDVYDGIEGIRPALWINLDS